ncbi:MAG: helix-turn-helix domain-containing protein, partial [Eubacterium sp.]
QAVSKWENETSCPDISLLTQIADLFGVTVDDLIRNSETDIVLAKENPNGEKREKSILKRKVIVNIRQLNGKENKIKIPLNLVNVGLRIGNSFGLDEVVSSKISEIIETENFGEIVSIDTENGEHITILVE